MAIDKIIIRSTPSITPNLITVLDTDTLKNEQDGPLFSKDLSTMGYSQKKGAQRPIIKLGTVLLPETSLKSLSVWYQDLVPSISITIIDENSVFGAGGYPLTNIDRKSTRLNSSHVSESRMPSSA